MDGSSWWGYRPSRPGFLVLLAAMLVFTAVVVEVRLVDYAFALAGVSPGVAFALLVASLLGSAVNIPVARIPTDTATTRPQVVRAFGVTYVVPVRVPGRMVIALNVGGAVVPIAFSTYLVVRSGQWQDALVAIAVVAFFVHFLARPVPSLGIVVHPILPALVATATALLLNPAHQVAMLAYVGGTCGTLIGADLTHLPAIRRMRAPAVSIGGAGTFDGVFVTGILAVLLAALL